MSADYRRHHAAQVVVIPVPVPAYEIGSPKSVRSIKPPSYQPAPREAWRPARDIPVRRGKAEALQRFLERWARQDSELKAFLRPDRAAMQGWLCRGAAA